MTRKVSTDKLLTLAVFNTSDQGPAPIGFLLVYHQATIENAVRGLAQNTVTMGATSIDVHLPTAQILTELHEITGAQHQQATDWTKLNLPSWTNSTMLTLKVYPNTHYGLLLEAWNDESGALYIHEAPIVPETPSHIIRPN